MMNALGEFCLNGKYAQVFQVPDTVLHMVQEYSVSQSCLEKLPSQGVRDHTDNKGV